MKIHGIFAAVLPRTSKIFLFRIRHFLCFTDCCIYIVVSSLLAIILNRNNSVSWQKKGVDNFFFIPTFHSIMPRNNEIRVSAKYSSIYTAPNSATTVSIEKFNIEKDAKNRAYAFILSSGYFKEFLHYCNQQHGNPFEDCHKLLTL